MTLIELSKTLLIQYGTHVIQKLIVHIPEKHRMLFNLMFAKFIVILSSDMYVVCAAKKFIENAKNEFFGNNYDQFYKYISKKYGNYLIQDLLENGGIRKKVHI